MLTLRESNAKEYLQIISHNYHSWGPPLSLDGYIDREMTLSKIAGETRCSWVLLRGQDVLSSCETYKRPLIAKIHGEVVNGWSFGVASVFTPPSQRHQGYASKMMKMLYEKVFSGHDDLIGKSKSVILGCHLYSDVGPDFYRKMGWNLHSSLNCEIHVKDFKSTRPKGLIQTICLQDVEFLMKSDIERTINDLKDDSFFIEPTVESISWLHARSVFFAEKLGKPSVSSVGVSCEENVLYVTRLHAPNIAQIPNLIEAAVAQAVFYGLEKVVIWDPDVNFWRSVEGANITNRTDSLSSMALQYKGVNLENFDWINNEKYAWV